MEVVKKTLVANLNTVYTKENSSSAVEVENLEKKTDKVQNINETEKEENKNDFTKKELDDALKKVNNFLKDEKTHAEYSIHDDLKTLMIKIVDDDSKKVILEIPPKKILDMVASMCKQVGLLDEKA